ncbi:hypothetical protein EDB83DRAFT_2477480 [Lactarius deliciosus]|nr:hypothetical protein EDB83DRAFT_2477480 [Lactarius deliciosus]
MRLPVALPHCARKGGTPPYLFASPPPLPLPSSCHLVRVERGHATPGSTLPIRGRGVHEGTSRPAPPFPLGRAAPYSREGCPRARDGTSPSAPLAPMGGYTRARHPRHLPSSRAAPYARDEGHSTPSPLPPFGRAALYARERGTPPPVPPFPIRAEGGCTRARRPVHAERGTRNTPSPPAPPLPSSTLYARERGMRGYATLVLSYSRGRGMHDPGTFDCAALNARERGVQGKTAPPLHLDPAAALSFLAVPPRTHRQGAREGKPPHPVAPRSHGKRHTCRAAWSPCASVHCACTPFSRAIVRLQQKKIDVD